VREVGGKLMLSNPTIHIAVAYMDYVLSKHDFPRHKLPLIAVTCLSLAAKYDELDKNIPPIQEYIRASGSKLPATRVDDLKECEVNVLRILAWNLRIITPLVFVETLLTQGVLHSTDLIEAHDRVSPYTAKLVTQHAFNFADLSLNSILVHIFNTPFSI